MTAAHIKSHPRLKARTAGVLYWIVIVAGLSAGAIRARFLVKDDAAATAENIVNFDPLFRVSLMADIIAAVGYLGVIIILYELLKPTSRTLSKIAATFALTALAVGTANLVEHGSAWLILLKSSSLNAFTPDQLQALALLSVEGHTMGYAIALFFSGFYCLSLGVLVLRSTYFPSVIGVLLLFAGASYLVITTVSIFDLALPEGTGIYLFAPPLLGEGLLALWLLLVGVNAKKWEEQARSSF